MYPTMLSSILKSLSYLEAKYKVLDIYYKTCFINSMYAYLKLLLDQLIILTLLTISK